MTRQEMVNHLYNKLVNCKHWGEVRKVFTECYDWNCEHYDEAEIFMAEGDDDTVAIEDDVVRFDF